MWMNLARLIPDFGTYFFIFKKIRAFIHNFSRGNPMHLNKELYWKIRRQWLHQEVAEEVINQYELNNRNMVYDWHNF
jgi:hypothetical protein